MWGFSHSFSTEYYTPSEACNVPISYCHQIMTCRSLVFLLHGESFGFPNKEKNFFLDIPLNTKEKEYIWTLYGLSLVT